LLNGLTCGLGHALIHLSYAFELEAPTVASEALALACVGWNQLQNLMQSLDVPSGTKSSLELIEAIRKDPMLPRFDTPGPNNLGQIMEDKTTMRTLMEIYAQWHAKHKSPSDILKELFETTTLVFAGSHKKDDPQYDFFLLHLVTSTSAIQTLHNVFDKDDLKTTFHCQLFMFSLLIYLAQLRPVIDKSLIASYRGKGDHSWNYVVDRAVNSPLAEDTHFVKVARALKDAAHHFGDDQQIFLNSALKLVDTMDQRGYVHWIWGANDDQDLNVES